GDDAIQLIEKKNVRRPARKLDDEPPKCDIFSAKRDPDNPVQRIFRNIQNMRAAELRTHHLAKRIQRDRLLLQVFCATVNQVETRAGRIDTDEKKLATQAKIDGKGKWAELIELAEVSANQSYPKLIDDTFNQRLIHCGSFGQDYRICKS